MIAEAAADAFSSKELIMLKSRWRSFQLFFNFIFWIALVLEYE